MGIYIHKERNKNMPNITPQHQLYPDASHSTFGKFEFIILNSQQSLTPKVRDISYYEPDRDFKYGKEITCTVDLDTAAITGTGNTATSFTYKEVVENTTGHTTVVHSGITIDSAMTYYINSGIFSGTTNCEIYHSVTTAMTFQFTTIIAQEECKLEYVYSEINIAEDISDEDKEKYYRLINDGNRSKTIEMEVVIQYDDVHEQWIHEVNFNVILKIGENYTDKHEHKSDLVSAIKDYDEVNLHRLVPQQ